MALSMGCIRLAATEYVWSHAYVGPDFFSGWNFYTDQDPTHGTVEYVDYSTAVAEGLVDATAERVLMSADTTSSGGPRRSVRIESKEVYNAGLFVITLDHIPTGCGTWPAFWLVGSDASHPWPTWGEYDIIEGEHSVSHSTTSLHTTSGCDQSSVAGVSWKWGTTKPGNNCDIHAPGQFENQGCGQAGPEGSMGREFNGRGGGTFAAEWDPVGTRFFFVGGHEPRIRTWFWPAGTEPADVLGHRPAPETWGAPYSYFSLDPWRCPSSHFRDMRLIFDLTFCGDLAGSTFASSCPAVAGRMECPEFVANHPQMFADAYWSVRALDVYTTTYVQSHWLGFLVADALLLAVIAVVALFCCCMRRSTAGFAPL